MPDLDKYVGREQTYIKHLFLTQYLRDAAFKTLQGRSKQFTFVDAFAGPWEINDKTDYSDASFDQAINVLEAVRASLGRTGKAGLKIKFCFCEKRKDRFAELQAYSEKHKKFDIHVFHGPFEENILEIEKVCGDGFTFSFIDPTGWDIDSERIFAYLKRRQGDAIINFMSNDINRFPNFESVSEAYGRLLADPAWKSDFERMPTELSNEEKILRIFKRKLKQSKAASFAPDMIIQDRLADRIKMRLILTTNAVQGLELFRNVQAKVEQQEIAVRDKTKRGNAQSLFSDELIAKMHQDAFGVGCKSNKEMAERYIGVLLEKHGSLQFQKISNFILERIPLKTTHVKDVLVKMKKSGSVDYPTEGRQWKPKSSTKITMT